MLLALKYKILLAFAAPLALTPLVLAASAWPPAPQTPSEIAAPAMVELQPHSFEHRQAGDFTRDGKPTTAPLRPIKLERPLVIMTHQVTAMEYQRCVDDQACPRAAGPVTRPDIPMVNVSGRDADAYASWLSGKLGVTFRLPTDEEWAFAAGSRFRDDAIRVESSSDPAQRWLARYEQESAREEAVDKEPRPLGSFGRDENGVADIAGNVWEWTSSCFVRQALDPEEVAFGMPVVNCGVRVVEGRHRTYMTDFVRNPRAGGCAVGVPPANLGFRLVRDQRGWEWLRTARAILRRAGA